VTADATASAGAAAGCAANIARAWPLLFALGATAAGRATLTDAFKLCAPLRDEVRRSSGRKPRVGCCMVHAVALLHVARFMLLQYCMVLRCCMLHRCMLHVVALRCIVLHCCTVHVALLHTALHAMQQRLLQRGVPPQLVQQ
jgi:hypothetical protein